MKAFSRRRFLQFSATASAQAQAFARWSLRGMALLFFGACRSLRDSFRPSVRWVIPSIVGDFVIDTAHDVEQVREFPVRVRARRLQFPAVAATLVDGTGSAEIDSDQVEMTDVWVIIDARPGTKLFRERDIVRSDVLTAQPSGDFTIEVTPQPLLPSLGEIVPLTVDTTGGSKAKRSIEKGLDRDRLLKFDFCVRPGVCQTGAGTGSPVRSTLPTVAARWPRLDLVIRPFGATAEPAYRIPRELLLRSESADLSDCGGPPRKLRWLAVQYVLPQSLVLDVREHVDGDRSLVRIAAQTVTVLVRPGFVDLLIPTGSILERRRDMKVLASTALAESHLHTAKLDAFAWASDMPAETTTLPAELSSEFCFRAGGPEPWPLLDAIELPRSGSRIDLQASAAHVTRVRVAATVRRKDGTISRSVEHDFSELTLIFRSARGRLAPQLTLKPQNGKTVTLSIFDGDGTMTAAESLADSDLVLVADLFARIQATSELDVRFHAKGDAYVADESTLVFATQEAAWAGRSSMPASAGDWVHLRPTLATPATQDYRAESSALASPATIRWEIDRDRFEILGSRDVTPSENEIVALAPEAFRASVAATLPHIGKAVGLPPFALREHRDFSEALTKWTDTSNAAFKRLTMWEPRTTGDADGNTHSPADLFASFAAAEGGTTARSVYAGFRIEGRLVPLRSREWAPDERGLAGVLAPYRAIAADALRPVEDAVDLLEPASPFRPCFKEAFKEGQRKDSIQRVVRDTNTEIALSPVGGTIGLDWHDEIQEIGLQEMVLHGFLGRYQKNYAIFADLLLPYGIRYNVLTLTSRQDSGKLRFCKKWWFTEPSKSYGDNNNVAITNLRPINSVNFNPDEPLLFKADVDFKNGNERWIDRDRTLQGIGLITVTGREDLRSFLTQTVPLREPQALTLFHDTPMRLHQVEWRAIAKGKVAEPCAPVGGCGGDVPRIIVTARGELEDVSGMTFDTRSVAATFDNTMNPNDGHWCAPAGDGLPQYATAALTLGDGVVRVDRPLNRNDTFELNANAEHTLRKPIKLRDVGLLQLVLGGDNDDFLDNEGTLTIHEKIHLQDKQVNQGGTAARDQKTEAEVDAALDFPAFTKGVSDVCEGNLAFRIKIAPRSFHAAFKKGLDAPADYEATLVADVGVPGLLVLKNCQVQSKPGQAVSFKPGDLAICGELLKEVFELLLDKLKGLLGFGSGGSGGKSPFSFELLDGLKGFMLNLRLPVPRIPFGIGSLEHLTFDLRLGLSIDISRSGVNTGSMFTFILGDYPRRGFGSLPWLDLELPDIARAIFKDLRPPTLTVTPFTVRFSTIFAVRVQPPKTNGLDIPNPFRSVCCQAVACISGEGGLAIAFDIGVANGTVSLTLGIVWCPHATFLISFSPQGVGGDEAFSFDEIALVVRLELNASVLGIVNIFVRVQAMAQLKLTCKESVLTHLEVSGTASIEVLFATVDVAFTVDLDPLLGIDPNACQHDKVGPQRLCVLPDPQDRAALAVEHFFKHTEVAA